MVDIATKKIVLKAELSSLIRRLREKSQIIVFSNGCFDIIHPGHTRSLQQAKAQGGVLIVGVNADESVSRLKGSERPIVSLKDRCEVLAALECVDYVVPFYEDTAIDTIKLIVPDVYVKAGYKKSNLPEATIVQGLGGRVVLLDLIFPPRSTTSIIKRIRDQGGES